MNELHWHQTYQHSTEELSLSVIRRKELVKVTSAPKMETENNEDRSIYSRLSKQPSQFYYLSNNILKINGEQSDNKPIDCTVDKDHQNNVDFINQVEEEGEEEIEDEVEEITLVVEDEEEEEEAKLQVLENEEESDVRIIVEEYDEEKDYDDDEEKDYDDDEEEEEVQVIENEEETEVIESEEETDVIESEEEKKIQLTVVPKNCFVPLVRVERFIDIPILPKDEILSNSSSSEDETEESKDDNDLMDYKKSSIDVKFFDNFISDEEFHRKAFELCNELESFKRLSELKKSLKKKNIL